MDRQLSEWIYVHREGNELIKGLPILLKILGRRDIEKEQEVTEQPEDLGKCHRLEARG